MKREEGELAKLRRAFASVSQAEPVPAACPSPEQIWGAVRGELSPGEIRQIVEHTAACASCAEDWRLAVALQKPVGASNVVHATERFSAGRRFRNWGLAAAAALAVAVVGIRWQQNMIDEQAVYRQGEQATIQSLVEEGRPLPRNEFLLRWSAPQGATYDVEVSTEDLRVVASADDLREPQFLVPASALAGLPPGTRLLWTVDAELPQGGQMRSEQTFVTTVQ